MLLEEQRKKIIGIALKVQKLGLVPLTFGNFSLRDNESGYICITPSGMPYEELCPEDIVVMNIDGEIVDGNRKPSIEAPLHCMAYRKRADIGGVVHTHSTYATAWANCNKEIPCISAEVAALVGGCVKCAPFEPMGTDELAEVTIDGLGQMDAVLMERHGAFAVGACVEAAFANAVIIEEAAKTAYISQQIGELIPIPEDMCEFLRKNTKENYGQ